MRFSDSTLLLPLRTALATLCLGTALNAFAATPTDELVLRLALWERDAKWCVAGPYRFPTKQLDSNQQPCDDGDMTLFNGLMCLVDDRGCEAVRDAFDKETGVWHRSPRIRLLGKNDRGNADSSPDMALGIQLYLVHRGTASEAAIWLDYLNRQKLTFCLAQTCIGIPYPKFCATDDCVLSPKDAATLAATVNFLQSAKGLGVLPDGPLRGALGTFSGLQPALESVAAGVNKLGFSEHIVGVGVLLLRKLGSTDQRLQSAAMTLQERNPGNAFFSWLAGSPRDQVLAETLRRCPADPNTLKLPMNEWQWERSNYPDKISGHYAWEHSSLWDCIFMAKIVQSM